MPCWNGENIHRALEIVGDGGEVDLDGGFGETSPSHSAQAVASLPCPEDLLDARAHAMDRLIPFMELAERFSFVAAPHAGGDDPGSAALCQHGITKMIAAIGAVGKHLTGIVGQGIGICFAVIDIGRCDRHFLDQRGIGIGANMGLEAVNGPLSLVFYPARIIIVFTG